GRRRHQPDAEPIGVCSRTCHRGRDRRKPSAGVRHVYGNASLLGAGMRKLIVLALVAGCLGVLASVAMAATRSVQVGDNYYVRPSGVPKITVSKGAKLKWRFGTG